LSEASATCVLAFPQNEALRWSTLLIYASNVIFAISTASLISLVV